MEQLPLSPAQLHRIWGIGTVQSVQRPTTGTVHQTVLLDTSIGQYALRSYRYSERALIVREHAIISFLTERGQPVVRPLSFAADATIIDANGQFHALFPVAQGQQLTRAVLGVHEAQAMGRCLGQLHLALADLPPQWQAQRNFAYDSATTLAKITHLEQVLEQAAPDSLQQAALRTLQQKREALLNLLNLPASDFAALPVQPIHGDYQESNLFFAAGNVSAVIDWDQTYLAPRAWELLRVFHYSFAFTPVLCVPFLAAYRTVAPLDPQELDQVFPAYRHKTTHDLWVLEEYFLHSNARVRRLLPAADTPTPAAAWAVLRPHLC